MHIFNRELNLPLTAEVILMDKISIHEHNVTLLATLTCLDNDSIWFRLVISAVQSAALSSVHSDPSDCL